MLGPIDKLERQIQDLDRIRPAQRAAIRIHLQNARDKAHKSLASPNALGMWFVGGVITDQLKKDEMEVKAVEVDIRNANKAVVSREVGRKDVTGNRLKTLTKLVLRGFLRHQF